MKNMELINKIKYNCSEVERLDNELEIKQKDLEDLLLPYLNLYIKYSYSINHISVGDDYIYISYSDYADDNESLTIPFSVILSENPQEEKERIDKINEENSTKEKKVREKIRIENTIKSLEQQLKGLE